MAAGVTIEDPATDLHRSTMSQSGADTIIHPGVSLEGRTSIGAGCEIHSGVRIVDSQIGDRVTSLQPLRDHRRHDRQRRVDRPVRASATSSRRSARARKVGNFVEMKKTALGAGSKAMHLTYLGDAIDRRETSTSAPARSPATTTASTEVHHDDRRRRLHRQRHAADRAGHRRQGRIRRHRHDHPRGRARRRAGGQRRASSGTSRAGCEKRRKRRRNSEVRNSECARTLIPDSRITRISHVRNHRLHRTEGRRPRPDRRPAAARVSRLRLGRRRRRPRRRGRPAAKRRQAVESRTGHRRRSDHRRLRRRPHALGDARPADRGERPSAPRLHRQDRRRPQRHHRELPRSEAANCSGRATSSSPRPTPKSSRIWSNAR